MNTTDTVVEGKVVLTCGVPGCSTRTQSQRAFCAKHWRMIPTYLRPSVWAAWDEGAIDVYRDYVARLGQRIAAGVGAWPER